MAPLSSHFDASFFLFQSHLIALSWVTFSCLKHPLTSISTFKQTKSNYWSFSKTPFKRRYLLLLPLPFLFCPSVQSFFGQRKVHRHWCIPTLSLMMREFFVATAKIAVFLADGSDPCTCCTCNFICILLQTYLYLYFLCKCLLTRLHCWRLTRLVLSANRSTLSHRLNGRAGLHWEGVEEYSRIF